MVVIAESTKRMIGNLFELEDLGAKNLKGVDEPMRAFLTNSICLSLNGRTSWRAIIIAPVRPFS